GGMGPREPGGAGGGARLGRRLLRRAAGREAPADDPLHEAAAELVARPLVARHDRPRARLARALDARRRVEGGGGGIPEPQVIVERDDSIAVVRLNRPKQLNA